MRARSIKPGFFKNCELADAGPYAQILFAGLWCMADREGRLKDQPRVIKAEVFPYYDCDVNGELTVMERLGLIRRYTVGQVAVIEVLNFKKHQAPHHTEKPSELPPAEAASSCSEKTPDIHREATVNSPLENGGNPSDSGLMTHDSLTHDSGPASHARAKRSPTDASRARTTTRGARIPEPFGVSPEMRAWAAEHCPHVADVDGATAEFVDYWRGVSGRYGVKLDWLGTWRNRLRELEGRASRKVPFAGNGARPIRLRTADEIEAEEAARGRQSAA